MFKKILVVIVMICISFLTGYTAAQSYFLNKEPALPQKKLTSSDLSEKNTLSPSDFQSQTQQVNSWQRNSGLRQNDEGGGNLFAASWIKN